MFSIIISITSAPTHERASTDSNSKLKGVKPLFDKILKESVSHYFVCFEQEIVLKFFDKSLVISLKICHN